MRVHVIETRLTGVTNQGLAVARVIGERVPCDVRVVPVRLRKRFLRSVAAWAVRRGLIGPTRLGLLARLLYSGLDAIGERPDVVITALGRGEYVSLLLGGADGAFTVHIGRPVYLAPTDFGLVLVTDDRPFEPMGMPFVRLPINPTPVLRADVEGRASAEAARLTAAAPQRWVLLAGGDGAGYVFAPTDWERIATGLTALARRHGAKLLVTTSRRTGGAGEALLERALGADVVLDAVWYGREPRPVVRDYLAAGDVVFCTEDSRSMIGDAIAAGRPVYTIRPADADVLPVHHAFVSAQERAQRIRRVAAGALESLDVDGDRQHWFRSLEGCWSTPVIETLVATPGFRARLADPDGPAASRRAPQ